MVSVARSGAAPQVVDAFGPGGELLAIPGAELAEALGNVIEPLAQLVARRQVASPLVQARALARDTARPDVVDQHTLTVAWVGRVVHALRAHVERHSSLAHGSIVVLT